MRTHIAKLTGKLISKTTRTLKIGGGSAAPGLYALKIDPNLVSKLSREIPQNIVITGTNGKTTTARLLSHFLESNDYKVVRNSTGSNLERGIASALIHNSLIKNHKSVYDVGVWELDEAAFNKVAPKIRPQLIIFLNAFRDQLDRYGEVDTVVDNWWKTLSKADWNPTLLINNGDTKTSTLAAINQDRPDLSELKIYKFRVTNHFIHGEKSIYSDRSKAKYKPDKKYFKDDFSATIIKNLGLKGNKIAIDYPGGKESLEFPIPGIYHIYDLLAAFGAAYLLNLPINLLTNSLIHFKPAFGRVEKLDIQGKESYIFLIKNPAGATAVFETIAPEIESKDTLLIALNDNFADGTDVSWIWDAQFEMLCHPDIRKKTNIICSGTRAHDLAVRLKYAGFNPESITVDNTLERALQQATRTQKGCLFILPTYTALLKLQDILTRSGVKSPYWKER
jgi:lipid II isoglutaminyl synthase (glutamine-hydrolysing)